MSRHTEMRGRLSRSFGSDGEEDQVVELDESGYVVFRREPLNRRLRRGEELPEVRLSVREVLSGVGKKAPATQSAEDILERILAKIPIAKFEGDTPRNLAYAMKVWLLREVKRVVDKEEPIEE